MVCEAFQNSSEAWPQEHEPSAHVEHVERRILRPGKGWNKERMHNISWQGKTITEELATSENIWSYCTVRRNAVQTRAGWPELLVYSLPSQVWIDVPPVAPAHPIDFIWRYFWVHEQAKKKSCNQKKENRILTSIFFRSYVLALSAVWSNKPSMRGNSFEIKRQSK
jgi:hypothetical protein